MTDLSDEMNYGHAFIFAALLAFPLTALLIFCVWFGGHMFYQRCEKAFPSDPARAELCIYNLSHGNKP